MKKLTNLEKWTILAGLVLFILSFGSCKGDNTPSRRNDTIVYDYYRGVNTSTHDVEPVLIDTAWNVYEATDTVFVGDYHIKVNIDTITTSSGMVHRVSLGVHLGQVRVINNKIIKVIKDTIHEDE